MSPDLPEPGEEVGNDPVLCECWRCGKSVEEDHSRCPYCRAILRRAEVEEYGDDAAAIRSVARSIKVVLWFFALQLIASISYAAYLRSDAGRPSGPRGEQERQLLHEMLVVEAIDTAIVLIAIALAGLAPPIHRTKKAKLAAWAAGAPVLGLLLGMNVLYSLMLRELIGKQPHLEVIEINLRTHFWLVLLAVCVQPAIVEELFFRYLALGHLRRVMGLHGAVWVSAVMFGMAHLYNPLSMPALIIVGAGLGYMRVASGGLALPILMHGFHNAIVLALDGKI
jgi:membrane protease YdiL (CAAX protease family)